MRMGGWCHRAEFRKETAESAGPCPEAPEAPPRGQEVKQSTVRVRGVLKNAASST